MRLDLLPKRGKNCVYFVVSEGEIIYVGRSDNIRRRISQHAKKGPERIYIMQCQAWDEARRTEDRMIKACRPRFNKGLSGSLTGSVIGVKDLELWNLDYVELRQSGKLLRSFTSGFFTGFS